MSTTTRSFTTVLAAGVLAVALSACSTDVSRTAPVVTTTSPVADVTAPTTPAPSPTAPSSTPAPSTTSSTVPSKTTTNPTPRTTASPSTTTRPTPAPATTPPATTTTAPTTTSAAPAGTAIGVPYAWNADPARFALPWSSQRPSAVHSTFAVVEPSEGAVLLVRADGGTFRTAELFTGVTGYKITAGANRYAVDVLCADGTARLVALINGFAWTASEHPATYVNTPLETVSGKCS
jgi:hypothetical protein